MIYINLKKLLKKYGDKAIGIFEKNKLSYTFAILTEVSHKSQSFIKEIYLQMISKESSILN